MNTKHQVIRVLLVAAILYLGTAGLLGSVLSVLYGDGLGPDYTDMTEFNIRWVIMVVFCLCSLVCCYGLIRRRRIGFVFGYVFAAIIVLMFLGEAYKHWVEVGRLTWMDVTWGTLFLATPIAISLGLRSLQRANPCHGQADN